MNYIENLEVTSRDFVISVQKRENEKILETSGYADTNFDK